MNREPLTPITDQDVAAYSRDGAVVLRRVFDSAWIALLSDGVARNMAAPSDLSHVYTSPGKPGFFFGDYCNWDRIDEYRRFVFDSPAAMVAGRMMKSTRVNFFHEHVLVKEAGTAERTPWHHDQPYWAVDGDQVCSLWTPLDTVSKETCVEFVAGSHRWGKWYTPRRFVDDRDNPTSNEGETIPDFDSRRDEFKFLSWDMEPGDCIVFHALTVHGAAGNPSTTTNRRAFASRWTGDDARFARRDGYMSPPFDAVTLAPGDVMDCATFPLIIPKS